MAEDNIESMLQNLEAAEEPLYRSPTLPELRELIAERAADTYFENGLPERFRNLPQSSTDVLAQDVAREEYKESPEGILKASVDPMDPVNIAMWAFPVGRIAATGTRAAAPAATRVAFPGTRALARGIWTYGGKGLAALRNANYREFGVKSVKFGLRAGEWVLDLGPSILVGATKYTIKHPIKGAILDSLLLGVSGATAWWGHDKLTKTKEDHDLRKANTETNSQLAENNLFYHLSQFADNPTAVDQVATNPEAYYSLLRAVQSRATDWYDADFNAPGRLDEAVTLYGGVRDYIDEVIESRHPGKLGWLRQSASERGDISDEGFGFGLQNHIIELTRAVQQQQQAQRANGEAQ